MTYSDPENPTEEVVEASGPSFASRLLQAWPYALVLLVGAVILMPNAGEFGFWDPWEPKYAQSSREMVERGSYVVPYYVGEVRLTKPILVYWGIIAGAAVFGMNEFGARIVGIGSAIAALLGVYYAVSLLRGRLAGLICAVVIGTSTQFYFIARQAMPDVYLFTSLGTALVFLFLGFFGPERRRNVHLAVSYACLGLAVLAKGPVLVGGIVGITLAIYAVLLLEPRKLFTPELRWETIRFLLGTAAGLEALGLFAVSMFLFGTSSNWWGYSSEGRDKVASVRLGVQNLFARTRLADAILVGAIVLTILLVVRLVRSGGVRSRPGMMKLAAFGATGVVCLATLFVTDIERKILAVSVIGTAGSVFLVAFSIRRYIGVPGISGWVAPWIRPVLVQLGLFAGVFTLVAGPWHIAVVLAEGHGYFTDFIVKHNITRAGEEINSGGYAYFYVRTLIYSMFPWSGFIPLAAMLVPWETREWSRRYGFEIGMIISCAVIFSAYTSSVTKFAHYLAPILLPAGIVIGLTVTRLLRGENRWASRMGWIVATMFFLMPMLDLVHGGGIRRLVGTFTVKSAVPEYLEPGTYVTAVLAVFGVSCLAMTLVRSRVLLVAMSLAAVLFGYYNTSYFIPEVSAGKSMKRLCATWERVRENDDPVGLHGDFKHGMYFYTERNFARLRSERQFTRHMDPDERRFCVISLEDLAEATRAYQKQFPERELYAVDESHVGFWLLSNYPVEGSRTVAEAQSEQKEQDAD